MNPENDTNKRYDINEIADDYTDFMNKQDLVLLNSEPTRHWSNTRSTLIDHFVTNCLEHVNNILTKHSFIADHDLVSILYHTDVITDKPQFRLIRNWSQLNRDNLIVQLDNNIENNQVFSITSVDNVWNIIVVQLN